MYDEFPHEAVKVVKTEISDGAGGSKVEWQTEGEPFPAFLDTPTSKELVYAMQIKVELDRYMYFPYGAVTLSKKDRIRCDGVDYEVTGNPEDQGGMHEVMRVPLKEVQ